MYRRWENFDQPIEEQRPGTSIRHESGPQQRQTGRESLQRVRRIIRRLHIIWRPVTTQDYETPLNREWRFLRLEYF
jgi:hypothetical protein